MLINNQIKGIKETCLYIHDLDSAKTFYHDTLGFPVIHHEPGKHIFFRAGRSVLLCFNPVDSRTKKSPPPHYADGPQHLAFEVSPADYDLLKNEFQQKGIQIIDQLVWGSGQESFYFKDPEGNVLEIVPEGVWD
ncbi:VOC family protein [Fulvivirga sedimenti]|uniref:VOC family protein n=1 Tax=Fulvivirga sedimenti TaxID=2879465 RepID=A0A9X1HVA4_9BACT|nr:VOC family protein [Fulvivirga sedimenti]MCA6078585.1 VOC family protein [Fulvivirga sedimenti]